MKEATRNEIIRLHYAGTDGLALPNGNGLAGRACSTLSRIRSRNFWSATRI
jgi:hypothetical protein